MIREGIVFHEHPLDDDKEVSIEEGLTQEVDEETSNIHKK